MKLVAIILAMLLAAGASGTQAHVHVQRKSGSLADFYISSDSVKLDVAAGGRQIKSDAPLRYVDLHFGPRHRTEQNTPISSFYRYTHQWPGAYFEGAFDGKVLTLRFADNVNIYRLSIDDQVATTINKPGNSEYRIDNLKNGTHTVRLDTLTESVAAPGSFEGFYIPPNETALPPPPTHSNQIEIIGDSYAAGYGTLSAKHECTQDEIHDTTDTQQAFGPLLAKHYDADYQINAVSGIGMVRNYDGSNGPVIPDIYPYTLFDKSVSYNDPSWQPQVVVIALGDNDFATPVKTGEKWADAAALRADFIATYVTFVKGVRAKNARATFILMDYNEDTLPATLAEIAAELKAQGETRVLLYHPGGGPFEQTGCDWHLSLNDHKRLASGLEAFIDAQSDIWK